LTESPTIFTLSEATWFFPATYSNPVRGLNDDEPQVAPPVTPGELITRSFIRKGWNCGRTRLATSGSATTGYTVQNGCCGVPKDVKGIGWVGQGFSPGTSVLVGTGISTIGLIGWPV